MNSEITIGDEDVCELEVAIETTTTRQSVSIFIVWERSWFASASRANPQQRLADEVIPNDLIDRRVGLECPPQIDVVAAIERQAAEEQQAVAHRPLVEVHHVRRIGPPLLIRDVG